MREAELGFEQTSLACVPFTTTLSCFTMSEARSSSRGRGAACTPRRSPCNPSSEDPRPWLRPVGEGAVGWQHGRGLQKPRPKAELRAPGTGKLRPVGGESLGGLWRFGNPAFQSWLHCVWGEPQNHVWPLGFHPCREQSFPPHSLPVPVAGACGQGWDGFSFRVALWLCCCALGEGRGAAGPGETAFFGVLDGAQSHSAAEAAPRTPSPPQRQSQGSRPTLTSTHLLGGFKQTAQLSKSQYSHLQNGNTKSPLKVFL